LTPVPAAARIEALRAILEREELDYHLVTHSSDIRWLTDWSGVFDEEQAHLLLVASQRATDDEPLGYLKTDSRYSAAMRAQATAANWQINDERIAQSDYLAERLKARAARDLSAGTGAARPLRLGIEADLALNRFRALEKVFTAAAPAAAPLSFRVELIECADLLSGLRARKDAGEVAALKAAQAITDAAFAQILNFIRPGLSERRVASELEYLMRKLGADGPAFPSIVASGPNSAVPHAVPGDRVLCTGDFVLLDFGARINGYCSDMTRTVILGKASAAQRRLYATVLDAHLQAAAAIRAGTTGAAVAEQVNALFAAAGYGELSHGLGHGVGLDIHELPVLAVKATETLEIGNVVTVEPGIYIQGQGGVRIENLGLIGEWGFESFTTSPRDLIEL
jgi:Xaa-Pro aminopeptidase